MLNVPFTVYLRGRLYHDLARLTGRINPPEGAGKGPAVAGGSPSGNVKKLSRILSYSSPGLCVRWALYRLGGSPKFLYWILNAVRMISSFIAGGLSLGRP